MAIGLTVGLVEVLVGTAAGAWLYSEEPAWPQSKNPDNQNPYPYLHASTSATDRISRGADQIREPTIRGFDHRRGIQPGKR